MKLLIVLANTKSAAYVISNENNKTSISFDGRKTMVCHSNEDFEKFSQLILEGINYEHYERDVDITIIDGCSDPKFRELFECQLKGTNAKRFVGISDVLKSIVMSDKTLQASKYGVNYDQKWYMLREDNLESGKFDLMAHTLSVDDVANYFLTDRKY